MTDEERRQRAREAYARWIAKPGNKERKHEQRTRADKKWRSKPENLEKMRQAGRIRKADPAIRARYNASAAMSRRAVYADPFERANILQKSKQRRADTALAAPIVYFVQGASYIKIGTTQNPTYRMYAMRNDSPVSLELLASCPGGRIEERALHARFAHLRAHGEWFHAAPELLAYIAELPKEAL